MSEQAAKTVRTVRTNTPTTPTGNQVIAGKHVIAPFLLRVDQEWQPDDKAAQRFKDSISKKVEQLLNNTSTGAAPGDDTETGAPGVSPDLFFDTGYMYLVCENAGWHNPGDEYVDVTHNLGQIPSRFTIFFSNDQDPDPTVDDIFVVAPYLIRDYNDEWIGFQVKMTSVNSLRLKVAADRCFQSGSSQQYKHGHFRILMWR